MTKSRLTAIILCFFIGCFGAHQFYIGNMKKGWIYLAVSVVTCGIVGVVLAVIDLIKLIIMSDSNFHQLVDDMEEEEI
ncbi:MAG: TM2 domain-containing protein [Bacteroidaceae bacterium]|nr:TM2 domain-containing protein [Bacteroidaceae bacterium]